jgi:hypothetical protein
MKPHALFAFLAFTVASTQSVECKILNRSDSYEKVTVSYWYPEITHPEGWVHSKKESAYSSTYTLIKNSDESVTISAVARERSDTPGLYTLKMYVDAYVSHFAQPDVGSEVRESESIKTSNGSSMRSIYFRDRKTNNFSLEAFGEEGDYYVMFSIESRDELLIERYKKDFIRTVESYSPPMATIEDLAKEAAAENAVRATPTKEEILGIVEKLNANDPKSFKKINSELFIKHYRFDVHQSIMKRGLTKNFTLAEIEEITRSNKDVMRMNNGLRGKYAVFLISILPGLFDEINRAYRIVEDVQSFEPQ